MLLTAALLIVAHLLALHLKRAGNLPATGPTEKLVGASETSQSRPTGSIAPLRI
jgi:hypothetical protein